MELNQIATVLETQLVHGPENWERIPIKAVFASDLMSDVLMGDRDNLLLLTSLSTEQSLRAAHIVGAEAVVIANNKAVTDRMAELARQHGIALLCTRFSKFESSVRIGRLMEPQ